MGQQVGSLKQCLILHVAHSQTSRPAGTGSVVSVLFHVTKYIYNAQGNRQTDNFLV